MAPQLDHRGWTVDEGRQPGSAQPFRAPWATVSCRATDLPPPGSPPISMSRSAGVTSTRRPSTSVRGATDLRSTVAPQDPHQRPSRLTTAASSGRTTGTSSPPQRPHGGGVFSAGQAGSGLNPCRFRRPRQVPHRWCQGGLPGNAAPQPRQCHSCGVLGVSGMSCSPSVALAGGGCPGAGVCGGAPVGQVATTSRICDSARCLSGSRRIGVRLSRVFQDRAVRTWPRY